jgi:hypothetical protein
MKNILLLVLGLSLGFSMVSCVYNDEETLYPQMPCDTTAVTYTLVIAPIIENRCYDCHDADAVISGIPLEGYDHLKAMVDAERLIGAIRHQTGFSFMPKDRPALPECEILKIEKWVAEGAQNN